MNTQSQSLSLDLLGRKLTIETGTLAAQASGSVVVSLGDTVILATAVMNDYARDNCDYFPLMVDYEEKFYATGKIKGSRFIKREGRPSDNAVLTSRLIDRPLRPLFPKGMKNEVQIICTVLSADLEVDPGTTAIIGASAALGVSGIPFEGPVASVRIGLVQNEKGEDELIISPSYEQCETGKLNMVVAGTADSITMVESGGKEVPEDIILEALKLAHTHIKAICQLQKQLIEQINPEAKEYIKIEKNQEAIDAIESFVSEEMLDQVIGKDKKEVKTRLHALEGNLLEKYQAQIDEEQYTERELKEILNDKVEKNMRKNIIKKGIRVDGRKLDEIRPISCQVGVLPRTHGSAIFKRGETQALTVTTLGSPGAAQIIDTMDDDREKRFIHHYNFPPFSVGEAKPQRGTSRREIGHGALAERALDSMIPAKDEFAYTMRLVSEILACNGSSSMASVCGSTLSLMDAGVPIKRPVSGIAMGLIMDEEGNYKILSDIQGLEDFAGDMDFKVAGTSEGINALQMDIKVKGLSIDIMEEALMQAKTGKDFILQQMLEALDQPRKQLSKYAPQIIQLNIKPDQIRSVIGKGGETIQAITKETGVDIDIEDDGLVVITAPDKESGEAATAWIKKITYEPGVGDVFDGKVPSIMEFGAFVEFCPGRAGLVHISELDNKRTDKVEDVVKLGDKVTVKLIKKDEQGRFNLSRKAALTVDPIKK